MSYVIRPMRQSDLAAVVAVQADAYGDYFLESSDVIAERFAISPATAWVAEANGDVCAYLVAYCSRVGKVTPLNSHFAIAENPDCLYLHDLAIAKRARGTGLAKLLVQIASEFARQQALPSMGLIAVQESKGFWSSFGFAEYQGLELSQQRNLHTYIDGDCPVLYMAKTLA